MLLATRRQHLGELGPEAPDEAVDEERGRRVQGEDEVVEVGQTLGRVDPGALLAGGDDRVGDDDLEDGLGDPREVADEEDDDDRGQGRRVVRLVPAIEKSKELFESWREKEILTSK